jgi:hypothetical protein
MQSEAWNIKGTCAPLGILLCAFVVNLVARVTSSLSFSHLPARMYSPSVTAAGLLFLTPRALAWGTLGHETIAYMAQDYVKSSTKTFVEDILSIKNSSYMASVSTWADSYRYTTEGAFSYPYHFIDANDSPPSSCSVEFDRDCGDTGCSVSAIANYTNILLHSSSSDSDKLDAMRFLIHFVGDIHQPLHDEALDVGGNDINVTYDGKSTNLHHIWDTEIVQQLATGDSDGSSSLSTASKLATNLTTTIADGTYGWNASSWLKGMDITDPQSSALVWAAEANTYVCSDVLIGGISAVESGDLSSAYFNQHYDVARIQIARAGYRLGAWLDLIAAAASA